MDISSIVGNLIGQSFGAQSTQQALPDNVAGALKKAEARTEQQISSTQVKLSAYGQIKGAFAEVQTTGNALAGLKKTATAADVTKAASAFVDAVNKGNKAVASATQGGKQTGALAGEARAQLAGSDLRRSLTQGSNLSDLKNIGITQNKDGSLAIDQKAFAKALQANPDQVRTTLAGVGGQLANTAAGELADKGNVGASVNKLGNRMHDLEAQQNAQQAAQQIVAQQYTQGNNLIAGSLTAYQRTFNS